MKTIPCFHLLLCALCCSGAWTSLPASAGAANLAGIELWKLEEKPKPAN